MCDLVKKSWGGGCFFLREGVARGAMFLLSTWGVIGMAWGSWAGGGIGMGGPFGGIFALRALRAHCALLLDYVPPEEPPSTAL